MFITAAATPGNKYSLIANTKHADVKKIFIYLKNIKKIQFSKTVVLHVSENLTELLRSPVTNNTADHDAINFSFYFIRKKRCEQIL